MSFPTFVHALNHIERHNPRLARSLEDSLDLAWERQLGRTERGLPVDEIIAMIYRAAEAIDPSPFPHAISAAAQQRGGDDVHGLVALS